MCFRLCSHYTAGYLFMAPREAILYSVWTPTCIQHVTLHFGDRRGTARRSVSEITPPQRFLRLNRSPIRYGFLGGAQAIRYTVNIALPFIQFPDNWKFQAVSSIDEFEMNESEIFNDAIRFQQLYVCLLDLDPCIDVTCHYHSLCKAFGPNDARCVCLDSCPTYKEPVCSSNGTTYDNKCLFEQEVCLNRLNFTVQHPGSCEGQPFRCLFCSGQRAPFHRILLTLLDW